MEFHVQLTQPLAHLAAIEQAILRLDPAALVDVDKEGQNLRIAAQMEAVDVVAALKRAGFGIDPLRVVQIPSICCGGCGG